jgi:hypothetical protein
LGAEVVANRLPVPVRRVIESAARTQELREQIAVNEKRYQAERDTNDLLQASLVALELAMGDHGWVQLIARSEQEFSREGSGRSAPHAGSSTSRTR